MNYLSTFMERVVLPVADVAEVLGCSTATVYRRIKEGILLTVPRKKNEKILVNLESLKR